MRHLVWFREDLRIRDNPALYQASLNHPEAILAIYVFDEAFLKKHDLAPCRMAFILRSLETLQLDLEKRGIAFQFLEVKNSSELPKLIFECLEKYHLQKLFYNIQYEIDELRRDKSVRQFLTAKNYLVESFHDQAILEPASVLTKQEQFYSIFTPFKNAWIQKAITENPKPLPLPKKLDLLLPSNEIPKTLPGFQSTVDPKLWPAGEANAHQRLKQFIENDLRVYDKQRDFPAENRTSHLSPYLASGCISARTCLDAALIANQYKYDTGNLGICVWISELIWRDFYKHILYAHPRLSMNQTYKIETQNIAWSGDPKHFEAWKKGETGFPLIDAAMRQLNTTGWMHNRLRMVAAMFLTKNLFLHWQWGEKYFMSTLIDGDFSANNGGWQWSASTGTDAAPYFRIFNPITQSERFDPHGEFIKHYCPELKDLDAKSIHEPYARHPLLASTLAYPRPIIDLKMNREKVLAAFKKAL